MQTFLRIAWAAGAACVMSGAMAQWVSLGNVDNMPSAHSTPPLMFVLESIDTQNNTVVVKRTQEAYVFAQELRGLVASPVAVTHVIGQRQYLCAKRQFHTPAAQYLSADNSVVHEYDYRQYRHHLFQLTRVDEGGEAEGILFRRVCGV